MQLHSTHKLFGHDDLRKATDARLVLSTWSGEHADEIGLNDKVLVKSAGPVHNYSYDEISVPLDFLHKGTNIFHIYAATEHHAAEVNWPEPVLKVEYKG